MERINELFQSGDWRSEKHVPSIDILDKPRKDTPLRVTVMVGKEMPHPNKMEHYISYIEMFFLPEGEKFPYLVGRYEFVTHGASAQGPDNSTIYSVPSITCTFKTGKPGTIMATAYCNIHGLWSGSLYLKF